MVTEVPTPIGPPGKRAAHRKPALRTARAIAALALLAAPLTQAGGAQATVTTAAAFCSKIPAHQVSTVVGKALKLTSAVKKGTILACLYSSSPTEAAISVETQTGLPASQVASRASAEKAARANFPTGTNIAFAPLPGLGPLAFTWTAIIGGSRFSGANDYKSSTGWFAEMPGALQPAKLAALVKLAIGA